MYKHVLDVKFNLLCSCSVVSRIMACSNFDYVL